MTAFREESKTTQWLNAVCRDSGCFTISSMNLMRSASPSTHRRAAIGTESCIAWKVITGTVNIGFEKPVTTRALKTCLAPLHGIQVTSPINASYMENSTNIYRRHCKKLLSRNGAHCLSTATPMLPTTKVTGSALASPRPLVNH